jgi:hypothetical protein
MAGELGPEMLGTGHLAGRRGQQPHEPVEVGRRDVGRQQDSAQAVAPELGVQRAKRRLGQVERASAAAQEVGGAMGMDRFRFMRWPKIPRTMRSSNGLRMIPGPLHPGAAPAVAFGP